MQVACECPVCEAPVRANVTGSVDSIGCQSCGWSRPIAPETMAGGSPARCLVCGCDDLWRQKDFPPRLGLTLVALGALLSTLAWLWYYPVAAIGILMGFALVDLALFSLMPDVLVCYRCGSRHRHTDVRDDHPRFSLELAERYRQEERRLKAE
ncbi:MAG TPA: hypothetical protein VML55_18265 [Planctomycetaceae bacterium]|nr:hypothetical protein [Planctomycetaceae bacterium]